MDFLLPCSHCGHENMVDLEKPTIKKIDKVNLVEVFMCEFCHMEFPFFFTSRILQETAEKLDKLAPRSRSYRFHFLKTLKKAILIRNKYGQSIDCN